MAGDEGVSLMDMADEAAAIEPQTPEPEAPEAEPAPEQAATKEPARAPAAPPQAEEPEAESEPEPEAHGAELQRELSELRERLARAEGALSVVNAPPPPEPEKDPYEDILNDPKFDEAFENDPAGAMRAKLGEMARVSRDRENAMRQQFDAAIRESDPDYRAAQEVYETLNKESWFQNLSADQKQGAAFAEYQRRKSQPATPSNGTAANSRQPRPPVATAPTRKVTSPPRELTPEEKFGEEIFRRMGGIGGGGYLETLNG